VRLPRHFLAATEPDQLQRPAGHVRGGVNGTSVRYQWRKDGGNIAGATNSSYMISSATEADNGSYDVFITNACGSATSSVAVFSATDNERRDRQLPGQYRREHRPQRVHGDDFVRYSVGHGQLV